MTTKIWVEEYRPKTLDEVILPKAIKKILQSQVDEGHLQNMMFCGAAGTGKTSVALALCDQLGLTSTVINASRDRGIDIIRNEISAFTSNMSVDDTGAHRVIILDEADMLTNEAQAALKGVIEDTSWICRYIFTTNNPNKIIKPISESRLVKIDFNFDRKQKNEIYPQAVKRIVQILEENNIKYKKEDIKDLLISTLPDLRQALGMLQLCCVNSEFVYTKFLDAKSAINTLIDAVIVNRSYIDIYHWLYDNQDIGASELIDLFYTKFVERQGGKPTEAVARLAMVMNDYNWKLGLVKNPLITLNAMFLAIMETPEIKE